MHRALPVIVRSRLSLFLALLVGCGEDPPAPRTESEGWRGIRFLADRLEDGSGELTGSWHGEQGAEPGLLPRATLELLRETAGERSWARLPVPLARREDGSLDHAPRWTGSVADSAPAEVLAGYLPYLFPRLAEFVDLPAPPDPRGDRRTLVRKDGRIHFEVPSHPAIHRVRLVAGYPPGFVADPERSAPVPTLRVLADDTELGSLALDPAARRAPVLEFELPAALRGDRLALDLDFQHCESPDPGGAFALLALHLLSEDGLDRVVLPQTDRGALEVRFAVPDPLRALHRADAPPIGSLQAFVPRVGDEIRLVLQPRAPYCLRVDGVDRTPPGEPGGIPVRLGDLAYTRIDLEFPTPYAGTVTCAQPAAAFRGTRPGLRGQESERDPGPVRHATLGLTTRRSVLVPVGGEFRCTVDLKEGDRIELEAGLQDRSGGPARTARAVLEIRLDEESEPLARAELVPQADWLSWNSSARTIVGRHELRFSFRGSGTQPLLEPMLLGLLGEPRIVPRAPLAEDPPNVLVYLVDTLRADRLHCYGHDRPTSPNLDALAADGVLFERVTAQAPWTKPSVASIFTGLLQSFHGAGKQNSLAPGATTLAEVMRDTGLLTAAFVSNPYVHVEGLNFEQGFSLFRAVQPDGRPPVAGDVTAQALEFLAANRDRPFFLYLHTLDPHEPYDPPPQTRGRFGGDRNGPLPSAQTMARTLRSRKDFGDETRQWLLDLYDEEILYNDLEFGKVVAALKELGLYDRTIVVFLSDHGELIADHENFGHGVDLWQQLLQVPLVIKPVGEAAPRGLRVPDRVACYSLLPTLARWVGADFDPHDCQGEDLAPFLRGQTSSQWCIAENEPSQRALLRDDDKLLRDGPDRAPVLSLFDLHDDRGEQRDLAGEDPAKVANLVRLLDEKLAADRARGLDRRSQSVRMSDDQIRRLQELGYLGEEPPAAGDRE